MASLTDLRHAALKGGVYLMMRQVLSVALKIVGVMLITRALGPASYGAYVSAFNIYQYVLAIGSAGIGVYLLRQEGEVAEKAFRTAYTTLAVLALVLTLSLEMGRQWLAEWVNVEGFEGVAAIIIFALPLQLLATPAYVRLERALNYRAIAFLETSSQVGYYLVAISLVWLGFGPKALAVAWIVQQGSTCIFAHVLSKTYPKFAFDLTLAKAMGRYSASFSAANWVWQLRMLINPMIVGPVLGAQAVGLVGMTIGLLEMLSIVKTIAWRLSVSVLGRVQSDLARLRMAVTEGMELQLLAVGSILLGFGWTGDFFVPLLFGERWAPVMDIYPYIAVGYLTAAPFNMHSATLSVINQNRYLAVAFLAHIPLFAITAYFAVPVIGVVGYGYGEIAALPAYAIVHYFLARAIGSPDYRLASVWWVATVIGLFWKEIGVWAIAVPFAALALPISVRRLTGYYKLIRRKKVAE